MCTLCEAQGGVIRGGLSSPGHLWTAWGHTSNMLLSVYRALQETWHFSAVSFYTHLRGQGSTSSSVLCVNVIKYTWVYLLPVVKLHKKGNERMIWPLTTHAQQTKGQFIFLTNPYEVGIRLVLDDDLCCAVFVTSHQVLSYKKKFPAKQQKGPWSIPFIVYTCTTPVVWSMSLPWPHLQNQP